MLIELVELIFAKLLVASTIVIGTLITLLFLHVYRSPKLPVGIPEPKSSFLVGHAFKFKVINAAQTFENWAWELGRIYAINIFGVKELIISDLNTIHEILKQRPQKYSRGNSIEDLGKVTKTLGLFGEEGAEWKLSRQIITPSFSTSKIQGMRECVAKVRTLYSILIFDQHALNLKEKFKQISKVHEELYEEMFKNDKLEYHPSKLKPLLPDLQEMALKIVLETGFLNQHSEDMINDSLLSDIGAFFEAIGEKLFDPFQTWRFIGDEKSDKTVKAIRDIIDHCIQNYELEKAKGIINEGKKTILESLLMARENENYKISNEKLKGNLLQLLLAGYETTASTLNWILFVLSTNETFQEKIKEEVDQVLEKKTIEEIIQHDITSFPYITSLVKECMRVYPVATVLTLESLEPVDILGYQIPKGTNINLLPRVASMRGIFTSMIGHLSEMPTKNPFDIVPERWNSLDDETYKKQSNCFLAFGAGSRICPGRNLAMLELVYTVALVFSDFKISAFPTPPGVQKPTEITKFTNVIDQNYIMISEL